MQKLLVEFQNISGNVPQVLCSVTGALNREETLSVLVFTNNSSEEGLHSGKSGQDLRVSVINMQNQLIDSAKNSELVAIPAGLDWIKNYYFYTNFKRCEVGQFLPPRRRWVSLPRFNEIKKY